MPHTILLNCYSTCPIQISLAYWIIAATSSFTLVPLSGWTIWAAQILFFYFFYYFFWDDSGNKICYIQNVLWFFAWWLVVVWCIPASRHFNASSGVWFQRWADPRNARTINHAVSSNSRVVGSVLLRAPIHVICSTVTLKLRHRVLSSAPPHHFLLSRAWRPMKRGPQDC